MFRPTALFVQGTKRYFKRVVAHLNVTTTFVDATNVELVNNAIQSNTKVAVIKFLYWSTQYD